MDIFNVLTLIGGLCLFLFGMNVMGDALERSADHCCNIAQSVLDAQRHSLHTHGAPESDKALYQMHYDNFVKKYID